MSTREEMELVGTAQWCKYSYSSYGKYSVDLLLEGEDLEKAREKGLNVRENYRNQKGELKYDGAPHLVVSIKDDQPEVADGGVPITYNGERFTGLVGNGSKIKVRIAVGDYARVNDRTGKVEGTGKYLRWLRGEILDLIEYTRPEEETA